MDLFVGHLITPLQRFPVQRFGVSDRPAVEEIPSYVLDAAFDFAFGFRVIQPAGFRFELVPRGEPQKVLTELDDRADSLAHHGLGVVKKDNLRHSGYVLQSVLEAG